MNFPFLPAMGRLLNPQRESGAVDDPTNKYHYGEGTRRPATYGVDHSLGSQKARMPYLSIPKGATGLPAHGVPTATMLNGDAFLGAGITPPTFAGSVPVYQQAPNNRLVRVSQQTTGNPRAQITLDAINASVAVKYGGKPRGDNVG